MTASLSQQAVKLNETIKNDNPVVYSLLSQKGRAIYFPKDGILAQSAEAKNTQINATIGIAVDDDGLPVRFSSIEERIKLSPKDIFPYAPSFGKPELREIWLTEMKKKNPHLHGKTTLPVVTNALTHGLNMTAYLFINPGNRIIIPDKIWGNYRLIFENAYGAVLDYFNTFSGNGFDINSFQEKITNANREKTIILFNFPNNPTGYTVSQDEAKQIVGIIKHEAQKGRKMIIICDDAYFGLVYQKGILQESLFSYIADLSENVLAIKVDGATKEQYVWGLRVGFITYATKNMTGESAAALEDKTAGAVRGSISNASHLSQSLILAALNSPDYQKEKKGKHHLLKSRYLKVKKVLSNPKYQRYFSPLPFNSGYFMCIKLRDGIDAEKVRQTLISRYSTGVIAIKNLLRIAYSGVSEKNIETLFENIFSACQTP